MKKKSPANKVIKKNPQTNKRTLREIQLRDPYANATMTGPIRHVKGTKPARKAKKYDQEMKRRKVSD